MSKVHIVVGDEVAYCLQTAIQSSESLAGDILILKDTLHIGMLKDLENNSFSTVRSMFCNALSESTSADNEIQDLENLMQISTQLSNENLDIVWLWMAPKAEDICAYYWVLHYLKKHLGKLYTIQINGLPFLDEEGKLFYPDSIAQLPSKEIIKAQKLARQVTPSEWETDGDEWKKLLEENAEMRLSVGGKKLEAATFEQYDNLILNACTAQFQKKNKLINNILSKQKVQVDSIFLNWRIREMESNQTLETTKTDLRLFQNADTAINTSDLNDDRTTA